eukprot:CAMPEP_0113607172 /NCGR_PEP_ID=MMETSP0017_2-20120614/3241_1 /TAXON_ID=2856 /ORGANISM="Cylindrotheca closterium" /LENGTH=355 /DNA_ID=CAMNT_0000515755 /DNA_START=186 /DNA_END=1253 /DNA_ORIENTATION=+ /assembly_acc=CAM_ASM_000147
MTTSMSLDQIQDEIAAMQRQEQSYYHYSSSSSSSCDLPSHYPLTSSTSCLSFQSQHSLPSMHRSKSRPNVHHPFRQYMVQWMHTIHDTFQLCPVVVPTAMYYLDSLTCAPNNPLDYQLCGLTSLHLAVKVHETRIFQLRQLLEMGNVCFTEEKVIDTERRILRACAWKLHPPVPEGYIYILGKLFYQNPQIPTTAMQILRTSVVCNLQAKPSVIAYASLLASMEQSFISMEQKQALCRNIMRVSGLTATSPGLAETYKVLGVRAPQVAVRPTATPQVYPVVKQSSPLARMRPQIIVQDDIPAADFSNLLTSPETFDDGEYREVITCAEDGIEVTFCDKPGLDFLDTISPRSVEGL